MGSYVYFTDEQKERANKVDLVNFLREQSEELIRSGREMRLKSDHSITVRGNEWYDHAIQEGGYAIDFVRRFYNLSFPEAVTTLLHGERGMAYPMAKTIEKGPSGPFALPNAHTDMHRTYAYLVKSRQINPDVVSCFAKQKLIYESCELSKDGSKEYHNAIFVGLDENGIPRHAHKHGIYTRGESFKGNVDGCNPEYSFHHVGTSNRLYVFEAPIDMLSFITLYPKEWQQHSFVSLCGVGGQGMVKILELYPNLNHVLLCLDHDPAGIEACEKFYNLLSEKKIQSGRLFPKYKDWNEDIKAVRGFCAIPAAAHPQYLLRDKICDELSIPSVCVCSTANDFSSMLQKVRIYMQKGRICETEICLKDMLASAVSAAARENQQMEHSHAIAAVEANLQSGFRAYENKRQLKVRIDMLETEIMSLRVLEHSENTSEKRVRCYEEIAAHCLKAVILVEQNQQKQEQQQSLEMKMV